MSTTRFAAVALVVLGMSTPARAEMIETTQLLAPSPADQRGRVDQFLAREDVRRELEAFGVSPADASVRVAGMTEAEMRAVSSRIGSLPAGGNISTIELLLIIVIILLLI